MPSPASPQVVLSGIVERGDSRSNLAVLALGEQAAQLVKPGDRVTEQWTVDSVGPSKVVLVARSGHKHTVLLGAHARQGDVVMPMAPPPPPPPPPAPMPDRFMIERAEAEFNMPEND